MYHVWVNKTLYSFNLGTQETPALRLAGDYQIFPDGVEFTGNTTDTQSAGYFKPPSGYTLDVSPLSAVGAAIDFTFRESPSGCFTDSPNLTQVGFFGSGVSQVKLQLSNCRKTPGRTVPQCRFAGGRTPSGTAPVTGSEPLIDGRRYRLLCVKSPDGASTAQVTMVLDGVSSQTFTIPRTGIIRSSAYLSVANKYLMSSQANNSDQYNGVVHQVVYVVGDSVAEVVDGLMLELM